MREVLLFVVMFVAILVLLGAMIAWSKFVDWRESVKRSRMAHADIMSRSQDAAPAIAPSSLQTDSRQTADRPMMPVPVAEEMLNIFRVLRAAGVKREALASAWRAAGLKLDNNLWAQAAPEEPPTLTPIVGRPTNAQFRESDPGLEYQPLK